MRNKPNKAYSDELYKAAKLDSNGDVRSKGKEAMAEDEIDDDGEAGPEMPPDMEEDIPDDEEGRFFGGGMEQKTAQAMQYIDQQEEDEVAVCSKAYKIQKDCDILTSLCYAAREI